MPFGENQIPLDFGHQISTTDVTQLAGSVQGALQKRFDLNTAKIDEMVQKVMTVPLSREKDKAYLADKVNTLINTVNQQLKVSGGNALLNNSMSTEINRYIGSAISDPYLKKQIANSQAEANFMAGLTELKSKKPDEYNDTNYAYALDKANYNAWKSGKVDDLGSLNYLSYRDVMGNAMKKAKEFKDLKGDQTIETIDPVNHQKITKKISGLTAEEIIQTVPGFLNAQDEQQLAIDGWGVYRGNKEAAQKDFLTASEAKKKEFEENIKVQDAIINSASKQPSSELVKRAQELKAQYTNGLTNLNSQIADIDKLNADQMGYAIVKDRFTKNISTLFSGRTSTTIEPDEVYYKQADLAIKEKELEMKAMEHVAKMKKEYGVGADGQPLAEGTGAYATSPEINQDTPEAEFYSGARKSMNEAYNTVIGTSTAAYNDVTTTDDERTLYKDSLNKYGYDIVNGAIVEKKDFKGGRISKAEAANLAFFNSHMDKTHTQSASLIGRENERRRALVTALVDAEKDTVTPEQTNRFLNSFQLAYSRLTSPRVTTTGYESPIQDIKTLSQRADMEKLAQKYGGLSAMVSKAKTNPAILAEMDSVLTKVSGRPSEILTEHFSKVGSKLKSLGIMPFVTSKASANVTDTKERESLVSLMSQEKMVGVGTFDSKLPMTIKMDDNGVTISQSRGVNSKGEPLAPATYYAEKGSALYNRVIQNVGTGTPQALDARDVMPNYKLNSINKPYFIEDNQDDKMGYFANFYNQSANDPIIKSKRLDDYVTKSTSLNRMKVELGNKFTEDQLENLIERVNSGYQNDLYKISVIPNQRNMWAAQLTKGGQVISTKNIGTTPTLSDAYRNIVQQYPNLVIMDAIVQYLKTNPKAIDNI